MVVKLRNQIHINPLDTTDKVAIGIRLPFNRVNIFTLDYTTKDHAKSKLINLLLTIPGERLNKPLFGVGLAQRVFEQGIDEETLRNLIERQVEIYVPELRVDNIKIAQDEHTVTLTCVYTLLLNYEEDSVSLNFNNTNINEF